MMEWAVLSDIGTNRQTNEDSYLVDPKKQFYIVADGMGGQAAGAVASKLAVSVISNFIENAEKPSELTWPFGYNVGLPYQHNVLKTAILLANSRVLQKAEQMEKDARMGTTLIAVWVQQQTVHYSHAGDCRLYLLKKGELTQLTEDHTLVQEQLNRGIITQEEMEHHALRHVVTKSIGGREDVEFEVEELPLAVGDQLLLCSDGLSSSLGNEDISRILQAEADLKIACEQLIRSALEAGSQDNITAVLLRLKPD